MYSRVNYMVVGLFVLLFGAGLVWFSFWLGKYGLQQKYDTYKLYMTESVAGLSKDSAVKLHGVTIGRVSKIDINPKNIEQVEIILEIRAGTPIKEDMVAHTKMLGITGLLAIEIDGGSNNAKNLTAKKGTIPVIRSAPSWFSETTEGLGKLSSNMGSLIDRAQKVLSDENLENFSKILNNLERISSKAEEVENKSIDTLQKFDQRLVEYNATLVKIGKDFTAMKNSAVPAINTLSKTTKNFNRVTLKVEKSLDRGDYDLKTILDPMMVEINILAEQINDMAYELKQSPSDIFFKSRKQRRGPGE